MIDHNPSRLPGLEAQQPERRRVAVFHDSSDDPFCAHVFLFVPTDCVPVLLARLHDARRKFDCNTKLHFTEFSGRAEKWGRTEQCAAEWLALGIDSLRRHGQKAFPQPLNCRLGTIAFPKRVKPDLKRFHGDPKERYVRWVETLIWIGMKSLLHSCYSAREPVLVSEFCTDGEPYARPLDAERVLGRLRLDCAPHVTIAGDAVMRAIVSDHRSAACASKSRAHLLQLTDLLLGAILSTATGLHGEQSKRERLSRGVRELLEKRERGRHFARSGHFKTFAMTHATTTGGRWHFSPLRVTDPKRLWQQLELEAHRSDGARQ